MREVMWLMSRRRRVWNRCFVQVVLGSFIGTAVANAGGLWVYEEAAPDMGRAGAGRAAEALDASTAGGNPAGMTRIQGSQYVGGLMGIIPTLEFDAKTTSFGGGDGGNAGKFTPSLSSFYVHRPFENEKLKNLRIGIGAGTYFGAGVDYDRNWAGRYYGQEVDFLTLGVNPVVAYRVTDWLSIGAGFSVLFGQLKLKAAVNNLLDAGSDGRIEYSDNDFGFGGNAGILIEPSETTRFGITYRSPVDFDFEDQPKLSNVGPILSAALGLSGNKGAKLETDWTVPQAVMASVYHELTERLAVMASVGWQDWSEFGQPEITVKGAAQSSFREDLGFEDTWHGAIGLRYQLGEPWILSLGFAYDSAALDSAGDRSPAFPIDRQIRYAAGVQYAWSQTLTLGVAYTYLDAGKAKINRTGGPLQGSLAGEYDTNRIQFVNVNLVWSF